MGDVEEETRELVELEDEPPDDPVEELGDEVLEGEELRDTGEEVAEDVDVEVDVLDEVDEGCTVTVAVTVTAVGHTARSPCQLLNFGEETTCIVSQIGPPSSIASWFRNMVTWFPT